MADDIIAIVAYYFLTRSVHLSDFAIRQMYESHPLSQTTIGLCGRKLSTSAQLGRLLRQPLQQPLVDPDL